MKSIASELAGALLQIIEIVPTQCAFIESASIVKLFEYDQPSNEQWVAPSQYVQGRF